MNCLSFLRTLNANQPDRLIVIPLSFLRRLDSLKYTSFIALVSIGYLVLLVIAHFVKGDTLEGKGDVRIIKWQSGLATLSSFPVLVFAYTCHQNASLQTSAMGAQKLIFTDVFNSQ